MSTLATMEPGLLAALVLSVAAGLDLYLTLVLMAVAPTLGFGAWLPEALRSSLAATVPLIMALGFYALEFAAERSRTIGVFWHLPQAVVRPVAAFLLTVLVLQGTPVAWPWAWAVLNAALAYSSHGLKTGAALLGWLYDVRAPSGLLLSIAEDVVVVGLVAAALDSPAWAVPATGAVLALLLLFSPNLLPASRLGRRLAWKRSWGSLTPFEWTDEAAMPARARSVLEAVERPFGKSLKAARCAVLATDRRRTLTPGWLVLGAARPYTLKARGRGGPVLDPLPEEGPLVLEHESLFLRLRLKNRPLHALIFPRSGPSGDVLEAELADRRIYAGNPPETGV